MRKFLQKLFRGTLKQFANKYDSKPDKQRVFSAFSKLFNDLLKGKTDKGLVLSVEDHSRFIIFSDQHKGARNGYDDFALAERNYLRALDYYNEEGFTYVNLGDAEELWKNSLSSVLKHNKFCFEKERRFVERGAYIKIVGNHDLYWANDPLAGLTLEKIYGKKLRVYEGLILRRVMADKTLINIFLTHGHQGDKQSDGNWFSKWFVSVIWGRLQAYFELNPNTPAFNDRLKNNHNMMMYEWIAQQKSTILITGHTHQPVFVSLTQLERLYHKLDKARAIEDIDLISKLNQEINQRIRFGDPVPDFTAYYPYYFNSGCCCFDDGDITGIEIIGGLIRLIKWKYDEIGLSQRIILEEISFEELISIDGL